MESTERPETSLSNGTEENVSCFGARHSLCALMEYLSVSKSKEVVFSCFIGTSLSKARGLFVELGSITLSRARQSVALVVITFRGRFLRRRPFFLHLCIGLTNTFLCSQTPETISTSSPIPTLRPKTLGTDSQTQTHNLQTLCLIRPQIRHLRSLRPRFRRRPFQRWSIDG
jgi:hypothetical protein